MKKIKSIIPLLLACCLTAAAHAQERQILTFQDYLNNVKEKNISYLAEQYNVDIAEANVKAARIFPDPEFSVAYANNQEWNLQMGYGFDAELSYTLELGGKRRARIRVAQSEKEMAAALVEDYFRHLRADATVAYLTALKARDTYAIQQASYQQMLRLAHADSVRFRLGAIMEVDAQQSRLEAASMLNEVHASEADWKDALLVLQLMQGSQTMEMPDSLAGELRSDPYDFDLAILTANALDSRADLQAALHGRELSANNLRLARANRAIDLGINLGGTYASEVRNEIAPAPSFKGFSAGISIPLKFSNTNKGEVRAARLAAEQSEAQYRAIEQQITLEVAQAYHRYTIACRQAIHFHTGMLRDAEMILEKKLYSYERGESSILELLNAQRTYNDVRLNYIEALYNQAVTRVELERVSSLF